MRFGALTADALRRVLPSSGIAWAAHAYGTVGSTNDVALKLAHSGAPEGTLVVAEVQTAGRGRRGNRWDSPEGGLWMSLILRPGFASVRRPGISLVSATAVARALHAVSGLPVRLKWPNDVHIGHRKIAGVMVEAAGDALVVGIGVNVNIPEDDLPTPRYYEATSLLSETGRLWDRSELVGRVLDAFESRYADYAAGDLVRALDEWRELSLVLGEMVAVTCGPLSFEGSVVGIDEDGAIIVRLPDGRQERVPPSGDVTCSLLETKTRHR